MAMPTETTPTNRKSSRYEWYRWTIFAVTWLAYAGFYLTRKSFAVAKTELEKPEVAGWSLSSMAWVDSAYLTVYAIGQFAWGILGDRFGTRLVILTGMFVSIVVAVIMGASNSVLLLASLIAVQGFVQASGWGPLSKNIGEFFSQRERGTIMGFWCTNYAFGGFAALIIASAAVTWVVYSASDTTNAWRSAIMAPAGILSMSSGTGGMMAYVSTAASLTGDVANSVGAPNAWRYAFWVPAGMLGIVWLLFLIFQRNRPEDVGLPPIEDYHGISEAVLVEGEDPEAELEGSWDTIFDVLKSRMVWLLAAVYFFLKPTRYAVLLWAPLYVTQRMQGVGIDSTVAASGFVGGMFDLAGLISVIAGGVASDYLFHSRRVPICVISLVLLSAFLLVFPLFPANRLAIGAGFFIIGFLLFIPDSLVSGTAAIDFGTKKGASTAAGLINGCGSIGALIGGTMPGWIEPLIGEGKDIWGYIFGTLSASLLIAALLLAPQWNTVPTTEDDTAADDEPDEPVT
jgi:MFS transporter, OPA family, glycerol-3-phosphate transporter